MFLNGLIVSRLGLPTSCYNRLLELLEKRDVSKKGLLIEEGKVCTFIGFVESGVLRSYLEKDGEEFISDFYFPDSIVTSYRSFLTKEPSVGSIQALENSTILCLTRTDYDMLLKESDAWYKLGKYISDILFVKYSVRKKMPQRNISFNG